MIGAYLGCAPSLKVIEQPLRILEDPEEVRVNMSGTVGQIELDLEAQTLGVNSTSELFLEYILIRAEDMIDRGQAPQLVLKSIETLLEDLSFMLPKSGDVQLFGEALKAGSTGIRLRDCDIGTYLYLSIAERLKLPLSAVIAPQHIFVRWRNDDGSYFNW